METTDRPLNTWLDLVETRTNAATPGPWKVADSTERVYLEPGKKCRLCVAERPLLSETTQTERDGHAWTIHTHQVEAHLIKSAADGDYVAGNYDYEEGGIVEGADTIFIAASRTDVPALVGALRAVLAEIAPHLEAPGPDSTSFTAAGKRVLAARIDAAITSATEGLL